MYIFFRTGGRMDGQSTIIIISGIFLRLPKKKNKPFGLLFKRVFSRFLFFQRRDIFPPPPPPPISFKIPRVWGYVLNAERTTDTYGGRPTGRARVPPEFAFPGYNLRRFAAIVDARAAKRVTRESCRFGDRGATCSGPTTGRSRRPGGWVVLRAAGGRACGRVDGVG